MQLSSRFGRRSGLLAAVAAGLLVAAGAQAADPIRIGLFAPLTGNVAANGTRFRDAAELYVEQVNAKGGIGGRPLELLVEDDRNSPKEAAAIAQKFVGTKDLVLAIGTFSTTASLAAAPIFAEARIPQISPSSSHPDFTRASPYQFRIAVTQDKLAAQNAEIVLNLGAKTVVIPYFQDDWGVYTANATKAAIEKAGGQVLLTEAIAPNARDFRPLVSKIKGLNPDIVFLAVHYQESAAFLQQLRQAGVTAKIASPDQLNNPKFIELGGKDVEGLVLYTSFFPEDPSKKPFVDAYAAKFGTAPDQWAARAYDAIGIGVAALNRVVAAGRPVAGEAIRDEIASGAPYAGVTGTLKYDEFRNTSTPQTLIVIRDGKFALYK